MDIKNLTNVYNQNPTLQGSYTLQQYLDLFGQTPPPATIGPVNPNAPTTPLNPGQGIINQNINRFQNQGGDRPSVVDSTSISEYRNPSASAYGPGGQLEVNPAAIGMNFSSQGNSRSEGPFGISTPPRSMANFAAAGTGPSELGYMTKDIEGLPGVNRDMIRGEYDNYSTFLGRNSGYENANVKGTASDLVNMIPYVGTFKRGLDFAGKALGLDGPKGPPSDRARYATDNGFAGGQGLGRDEFGVYTGGKTLLGKTANYQERIGNRLGELESFFSKKGIDLDDPNLDIDKMKSINGFYTKQYFAYKKRGEVDLLNRKTRQAAETKKRNDKIAADKIAFDKEKAANQAFQDAMANQQAFYDNLNNGGGSTAGGGNPTSSQARESRDNAGGGAAANRGDEGSGWDSSPFAKGGVVSLRNGGSTNGSGKAALSAKVKELMDDGYEFGEAVKEAMKQGYMNGGRIKSYFKGGLVSLRGK